MSFLRYQPEHRLACVSIFESNTPGYFAAQEKEKFIAFLNRPNKSYFVVMNAKGEVVACGCYNFNSTKTMAWLRWAMVQRSLHQHGLGRYLTLGRMALICNEKQVDSLHVGTSQHTYLFHEKLGFETYQITKNGLAPDIDEYLLRIKIDKSMKKIIWKQWKNIANTLIF